MHLSAGWRQNDRGSGLGRRPSRTPVADTRRAKARSRSFTLIELLAVLRRLEKRPGVALVDLVTEFPGERGLSVTRRVRR